MAIPLALAVHNAVIAVCTIVGVSIGDPTDKTSWSINYGTTPPPACSVQAQATLEAFDLSAWTANQAVQDQIDALESQETPRRIREAMVSGDNTYLKALDAQITALRAQLKPVTP